MARTAFLTSRISAYLTIPLLFLMGALGSDTWPGAKAGSVLDRAARSDRMDARALQPLVPLQQRLRSAQPVGVIVTVGQARQPQKLVDHRLLVSQRAADRFLVRGPGVTRDQLQMRLELGPARKPKLTSDNQLRVGAREAVQLR